MDTLPLSIRHQSCAGGSWELLVSCSLCHCLQEATLPTPASTWWPCIQGHFLPRNWGNRSKIKVGLVFPHVTEVKMKILVMVSLSCLRITMWIYYYKRDLLSMGGRQCKMQGLQSHVEREQTWKDALWLILSQGTRTQSFHLLYWRWSVSYGINTFVV